jgi:hypothetical protein
MNSKILACLAASAAALFLAGCNSTPTYPVTYNIPVGYSTVATPYGTQSINVSATHDSNVAPGVPMYYQVNSPIPVTVYVFDKTGPGPGGPLLNQTQGTNVTSSASSTSGILEFVFSIAQAYTSGTVQLTISDQPLSPSATPLGAPAPVTQQTTTTTTGPTPVMPVPATTSSTTSTTTTTTAPAPTPVMNQTQGP